MVFSPAVAQTNCTADDHGTQKNTPFLVPTFLGGSQLPLRFLFAVQWGGGVPINPPNVI